MKTKKEILENLNYIIDEYNFTFGFYQIINKNSKESLESFNIDCKTVQNKFEEYIYILNDDNLDDFDIYFNKNENSNIFPIIYGLLRKIYVPEFIYADLKLTALLGGDNDKN